MRDQIRKMVMVLGFMAALGTTSAHAGVNSDATTDESSKASSSVDRSDSEKKSKTTNDDKGWKKTKDRSHGVKQSTTKALAKAIDNVNSAAFSSELAVVPVMLTPYRNAYPWLKRMKLDDVLLVSTDGGTHTSTLDYYKSLAETNADEAKDYIDSAKVQKYMLILQQVGLTIAKAIPADAPKMVFGLEDWQEIADLNFKFNKLLPPKFDVSGDCRFKGTVNNIECGDCVLEISQKNNAPELICGGGIPILTSSSAGGKIVKVSANTSYSLKDSETLSQNDEAFRSLTHSLQEFEGHAAASGHAVEAMYAKKTLLEKMAQGSKKVTAAIQAVEKKDNPHGVLSMLGISGAN